MDDVSAVTTLQELCKRKGWNPPRFSVIRMTEDSRPRYIYMVSYMPEKRTMYIKTYSEFRQIN
jgi:hypothetical protein